MKKYRPHYFVLLLFVIFLGIMSRKISLIPLFMGDLLYAVMMYVLVRILLIDKKAFQIMLISLLICYGIEFFQLYQAPWIIEIRKTFFGKYVLGQGFLWTDILAYSFGILITFFVERIAFKYYH